MKKKLLLLLSIAVCSTFFAGCGNKVADIQNVSAADTATIATDDYTGTMTYEVVSASVITNLEENNVDMDKIDPYMFVLTQNSDGEEEYIDYPDFIDENANLIDGCKMYIVKLRVTNTDAKYKYGDDDNYDSPYIFRADNIFLNYISENQKTTIPMAINYYSLRKEGTSTWCTFQLEPGETIEYEIGFILGPIVDDNSSQKTVEVDKERLFLSGGTGYYQIDWEER
jgi:predicted small secreted protein